MTDPLSAVGAAGAILELATAAARTSMKVYQLVSTIRNAPREIKNLGRDIKDFHTLVQHLSEALDSPDIRELIDREKPISRAVADLQYPIGKCELSCRQVESKLGLQLQLDKAEGSGNHDTGNGKQDRVWVRDWMWPIRRKEIYQLISELQRTRLLFSDAMGSLTLMLMLRSSATAMKNSSPQRERQEDAGLKLQEMALADDLSGITLVEENKKSTDPKRVEELLAAVRSQSIFTVELLLQHIDVNARDLRDGRTAVSVAAEVGDVEIMKLLVKHGASVNIRQYSLSKRSLGSELNEQPMMVSGRFPIWWAVTKRQSAVVKLLLEYGASPNARTTAGRTVIQEACCVNDPTSLRMLLEAGADVDASNLSSGWTGVHEAANCGHDEALRVLLEFKPLLDVPAVGEPEAFAPLHLSVRYGWTETTNLLLSSGADPNVIMNEDMTPLHLAASAGSIIELDLLLDWGASPNSQDARLRETPLHKAARNLEIDAIQRLCERGADTGVKNIDGMTYEEVLECAQRYPNDWLVDPTLGSFCYFY